MEQSRKLVTEIPGPRSRALWERRERAIPPGVGTTLPVFVVGMPRSGTTLVEQILASHPRVFGAGELTDMGNLVARLPLLLNRPATFPFCLRDMTSPQAQTIAAQYLQGLRQRQRRLRRQR